MTKEELFADQFFGIALEWHLFLGGLVLGAALGAVYDLLRAARMTVRHPAWAVAAEDFIFTLFWGLAFYSYCTELCRGQIRFFVLAAMALGFVAYLATVGRLVSLAVGTALKRIKMLIMVLAKMLKKLAGILCLVPYFQKDEGKFEENPCSDGEADV